MGTPTLNVGHSVASSVTPGCIKRRKLAEPGACKAFCFLTVEASGLQAGSHSYSGAFLIMVDIPPTGSQTKPFPPNIASCLAIAYNREQSNYNTGDILRSKNKKLKTLQ